ncbi:hypothetical protein [Roseovarius ramblicola]|uniref:Uncharacterized protein n=1 Tax=Roseovarius ramblicola TaxID=2022336 RepID=A0ABV5HVB3_9RHOB
MNFLFVIFAMVGATYSLIAGSAPAVANDWKREEVVDRMTDEVSVWYRADSSHAFDCGNGLSDAQIFLTCTSTGPAALLGTTNCYFFDDHVISFRVDKHPKDMLLATPQDSGKSVHLGSLVNPSRPSHLLAAIRSGKTLLIELNPAYSEKEIVEFGVEGLMDVVGSDFDQCR